MSDEIEKCMWSHVGHTWESGDEDRYCVNDECDMCSCCVTDDDCSDCELFEIEEK